MTCQVVRRWVEVTVTQGGQHHEPVGAQTSDRQQQEDNVGNNRDADAGTRAKVHTLTYRRCGGHV